MSDPCVKRSLVRDPFKSIVVDHTPDNVDFWIGKFTKLRVRVAR